MKQIRFAIDRFLGVADPVWPELRGEDQPSLSPCGGPHFHSFDTFQMYTI